MVKSKAEKSRSLMTLWAQDYQPLDFFSVREKWTQFVQAIIGKLMAICIIEHLNSILEIHEVKSKEEND